MFFESLQKTVLRMLKRQFGQRPRLRKEQSSHFAAVAAEVLTERKLLSGTAAGVAQAAAASSAPHFALDGHGNLDRISGNVTTQIASGVQSFAASTDGQTVFWLANSGTLYKSLNGGPAKFVDGNVESFALANNSVGVVDLTVQGTLEEGYQGNVFSSTKVAIASKNDAPSPGNRVQSYAVSPDGKTVYWQTYGGQLYKSTNDAAVQFLDSQVESFALANNASGFVALSEMGQLEEGFLFYNVFTPSKVAPPYMNEVPNATNRVQSFAVSPDGNTVYWLTDAGTLYKSVNDGAVQRVDSGVETFALANNSAGVVDLTIQGTLEEGSAGNVFSTTKVAVASKNDGPTPANRVQSFAVSSDGSTVYWLTNGGTLYKSVNDGAVQVIDSGVSSFAPAGNSAGVVDLTLQGALRAGANGPVFATGGVNTFTVTAGGQVVYWLGPDGILNETINGVGAIAGQTAIASNVRDFKLADQGQAIVELLNNGALVETTFGNSSILLANGGVQSVAVGNGSQAVYWQTTGGNLNQSLNGGSSALTNSGYLVQSGVASFALADQGQSVVILQANGSLNEVTPGYVTINFANSGVRAFAAGNGSQVVYWLTNNGNLFSQAIYGAWGYLPGLTSPGTQILGGVSSFALADQGQAVVALQSNGQLTEITSSPGTMTLANSGVQAFAVGRGTQNVYWQNANNTLLVSINGGPPSVVSYLINSFTIDALGNVSVADTLAVVPDPAVRALIRAEFTDHQSINWNDVIQITNQIESEGPTVSAAAYASLQSLLSLSNVLNMPFLVIVLTKDVVNGNAGNATYQSLDGLGNVVSVVMGNLKAGSSSTQLKNLVNTWFLGMNEPRADARYSNAYGNLFIGGNNGTPIFTDVQQGAVGDCWLMASLAEAAARQPGLIKSMFTYDGANVVNGQLVSVYTVRYFTNGVANYVTVDSELPSGGHYYDNIGNGMALWAALAEKAYVVANGAGMVTTSSPGANAYGALDGFDPVHGGGYPQWALAAITGQAVNSSPMQVNLGFINISLAGNAGSILQAGNLVVFSTQNPQSKSIVPSHVYALVGYDPSSANPFELYNPWGLSTASAAGVSGLFYCNQQFVNQNFVWFTYAP